MTLDQAVFILTGDQARQHDAADKKADAQVIWLKKLADKQGRTLTDFAMLGPLGLAAFVKEHTGKAVRPHLLHSILQEPEFKP